MEKTGENFTPNGTVQISPGLAATNLSFFWRSVVLVWWSKWFSDIQVISVKTRKEEYLWRCSFFFDKFPLGRTVPSVVPSKRPVFTCKRIALKVYALNSEKPILQLCVEWPGLWVEARLGVTLSWYKPLCLSHANVLLSITTTWFTWEKQRGLYQNKVTPSLASTQRPGHSTYNCKMGYLIAGIWFSLHIASPIKVRNITLCNWTPVSGLWGCGRWNLKC